MVFKEVQKSLKNNNEKYLDRVRNSNLEKKIRRKVTRAY